MLRGLWKLVWVELKIFMREPMGSVSTLLMPVVLFLGIGRTLRKIDNESFHPDAWIGTSLPVLVAIVIAINGVLSLATIMSIYRESGILKRLKATPLRPVTILTAHVIVKLLLTAINIASLLLVGKRYLGVGMEGSLFSFSLAVTISTVSILSIGFVIAGIVPTARFAQLIAGTILYPLFALSGLFFPVDSLSPALRVAAEVSPLTHAVALTTGIWQGQPWAAHSIDVLALAATTAFCVILSTRVFRWE